MGYLPLCTVLYSCTVLASPAEVLQRLPDGELPVQRELLGHVADTGPGHSAAERQYYLLILRSALSIETQCNAKQAINGSTWNWDACPQSKSFIDR